MLTSIKYRYMYASFFLRILIVIYTCKTSQKYTQFKARPSCQRKNIRIFLIFQKKRNDYLVLKMSHLILALILYFLIIIANQFKPIKFQSFSTRSSRASRTANSFGFSAVCFCASHTATNYGSTNGS